ncbi:MAG: NAD(P)-dependent alcohol dehydrogenase [Dehalococcoidia bacterium]|nr:MAG: NAD(P)-dependent alcohol dehydrogenase [Dehalococcoidia bacterium]
MKIKAAVLFEMGQPLTVEEVDLGGPNEGEVLVKMVGTGLCHTDLSSAKGDLPVPTPIVLGHEGAGIVADVGRGVTRVKAGDHVVLTGAASCGRCRFCVTGKPVLCEVFQPLRFNGTLPGGQRRLSRNRQKLNHYFLQSSFAEYAVVPQEVAIKVRADAPLEKVGFLGCGGVTGLSSVIYSAQVKAGSSVAIFGCGTVGLCALMAARLVGAGRIITVDVLDNKLNLAHDLGATETVNAAKENALDRINTLTSGGADYYFLAMDKADVMAQVIDALPLGGTCILLGAPHSGTRFSLNVGELLREKTVRGSSMGSGRASLDIPLYVDLFMSGRLPLDKLITRTYPLTEINSAMKSLEYGKVVKAVITF